MEGDSRAELERKGIELFAMVSAREKRNRFTFSPKNRQLLQLRGDCNALLYLDYTAAAIVYIKVWLNEGRIENFEFYGRDARPRSMLMTYVALDSGLTSWDPSGRVHRPL
ncbi:hypothetical protein EVAR_24785_1 [Eumeta japonica]|uniref:Uncharacterized protein n=1 Tax=Eumeta variegata TaxID=151549 RepID=A0A4C1W2U4_EUMVA|nr:hypothetical protein EVAR_24785_1 [Eumeta japonica]